MSGIIGSGRGSTRRDAIRLLLEEELLLHRSHLRRRNLAIRLLWNMLRWWRRRWSSESSFKDEDGFRPCLIRERITPDRTAFPSVQRLERFRSSVYSPSVVLSPVDERKSRMTSSV